MVVDHNKQTLEVQIEGRKDSGKYRDTLNRRNKTQSSDELQQLLPATLPEELYLCHDAISEETNSAALRSLPGLASQSSSKAAADLAMSSQLLLNTNRSLDRSSGGASASSLELIGTFS